jgi:2-phospho-L-lactate guanylyltransferase
VAILVPVKDLARAKSRLAPLLSLPERRELAWRMLETVLRALAAAAEAFAAPPFPATPRLALRRVVVTSYAPAMELARALGFAVLEEARQVSESESVDAASATLAREGVTGVLRVPLDLPLLGAAHVTPLLQAIAEGAAAAQPLALLVPSRDRRGTNALYRSPPTLFPSRFGPDSLALHEQAARAAAPPGRVQVLPLDGFALDVDDPGDVAALLDARVPSGTSCPALDYLRALGVGERVGLQP